LHDSATQTHRIISLGDFTAANTNPSREQHHVVLELRDKQGRSVSYDEAVYDTPDALLEVTAEKSLYADGFGRGNLQPLRSPLRRCGA
jgi:hypothetical protein